MEFDEDFKICPVNTSLEVSQYGRVRKKSNGDIVKQTIFSNHLIVEDPRNEKPLEWVHRLVAFTWIDVDKNHSGEYVHHKNNNSFDNRADNLCWVTGEEHAEAHGIQVLDASEV